MVEAYKMYIDGNFVDSTNKVTFESYNPENNTAWSSFPEASIDDVDKPWDQQKKHLKHGQH